MAKEILMPSGIQTATLYAEHGWHKKPSRKSITVGTLGMKEWHFFCSGCETPPLARRTSSLQQRCASPADASKPAHGRLFP
eukprot:3642045-Amphidinium_carterae.1